MKSAVSSCCRKTLTVSDVISLLGMKRGLVVDNTGDKVPGIYKDYALSMHNLTFGCRFFQILVVVQIKNQAVKWQVFLKLGLPLSTAMSVDAMCKT